jgi:hypothetical protein
MFCINVLKDCAADPMAQSFWQTHLEPPDTAASACTKLGISKF